MSSASESRGDVSWPVRPQKGLVRIPKELLFESVDIVVEFSDGANLKRPFGGIVVPSADDVVVKDATLHIEDNDLHLTVKVDVGNVEIPVDEKPNWFRTFWRWR